MKLGYFTLDDLKPDFVIDDKYYFVLRNLTRPLRVGARIKLGSRMFYVHRCDKMLTDDPGYEENPRGYGVLCIETHYGSLKKDAPEGY